MTVTVAPRNTLRSGGKDHGPGAELDLDAAEAAALRKRGVLVDPDAPVAPAPAGVGTTAADGPTVTEQRS